MKRKIPVLIGLAVLAIIVFLNACSPAEAEQKMEQFEEKVEQKLEDTQNALAAATISKEPTVSAETTPAPTAAPGMLTAEDAKAIAVEHAGLTGQQISRLSARYEIDDRIPQYEVEFYHNGIEYDYEIHAETGEILSFDKDAD